MFGKYFGKAVTAIVAAFGIAGLALAAPAEGEALKRKAETEALLRAEGVPINPYLPVIETEAEVKPRTVREIGERAMSLIIVHVRALDATREDAAGLVRRYGLEAALTPEEREFLAKDELTDRDKAKFAWRIEAAWVLLWALGYVDGLEKPTAICDVETAMKIMSARTHDAVLADARPRTMPEILDRADRIYRYHWAARDAQLNGDPIPADLNYDVIMERHHALNWLVGYSGADWDDVTTDT